MAGSIPHLSVEGWIKNSEQKLLKLFEYFLTSEYSQSNIYYGNIASLKYILQNATEVNEIKNDISKSLYSMYGRYFSNVDVTVDIVEKDSVVEYYINVVVIDENNNTYRLDKSILVTDNNIKNMDDLMSGIRE